LYQSIVPIWTERYGMPRELGEPYRTMWVKSLDSDQPVPPEEDEFHEPCELCGKPITEWDPDEYFATGCKICKDCAREQREAQARLDRYMAGQEVNESGERNMSQYTNTRRVVIKTSDGDIHIPVGAAITIGKGASITEAVNVVFDGQQYLLEVGDQISAGDILPAIVEAKKKRGPLSPDEIAKVMKEPPEGEEDVLTEPGYDDLGGEYDDQEDEDDEDEEGEEDT
jgi:hypothetical protein